MVKLPCFIILTPGFPANEGDTSVLPFAQSFVQSFCKNYPELKLFVVSFQYPYTLTRYYWHKAEVIPLYGANKAGLKRKITWLKALNTIRLLKKQYQVKGIFSFWLSECALVGQHAQKLFGIKQISWLLGQDAKSSNKLLKYLSINNQNVVAVSSHLVEQLTKHKQIGKIEVIPTGINPTYFDSIKEAESNYDILGVGSLIELKNYPLFIKIIAALKDDFASINVAIIGAGPQNKIIEQLIEEYALQNNVCLVGELQHEAVIANMKASKILLHTSNYEGQAAVFNEALYCGMQVVCFDVGRLHSNEDMFVCNDEMTLVETIKQLLTKTTSRKKILLQSMDDTVQQVMRLYA